MPDINELIKRLPSATTTGSYEKTEGVFIESALVEGKGKQVFVETVYGPNVPTQVYTLNIGGRGALVFPEQEFRDILASLLALYVANHARRLKE